MDGCSRLSRRLRELRSRLTASFLVTAVLARRDTGGLFPSLNALTQFDYLDA